METEINKDTLIAYLDGELEPSEMQRVSALLVAHPDLDAWIRRQEKLRDQLKGAFADIVVAPTPERLVRTVRTAPLSLRWQMRQWLPVLSARIWVPVGAALAVGLALGLFFQPENDLSLSGGELIARGALGAALNSKLASAGYDGAGPRIGITFRDRTGHDCRSFISGGQAGVACNQENRWVVGTLVSQPQEPRSAYRMAGSEMPDAIRQAVMANIQGAPFDAAAEKSARDQGWK